MLKYDPKSPTLSLLRVILCFSVVVCGTAGAVYILWRIHWVGAIVVGYPVLILLADIFVTGRKSVSWYFVDCVRHIVVLSGVTVGIWFLWNIYWIIALVAVFPIFFVVLNLVGFLTGPLYDFLTPEGRAARKALREFKQWRDELKRDSKG